MNSTFVSLIALLLSLGSSAQEAPPPRLALIVHPDSGVTTLSSSDAINIFMGRYRKLPSGAVATPIDINEHSEERRQFYAQVVRKDLATVDAYWARLVFSGQTSPPLKVPDSRTAVDLVAGNRTAVAYVDHAVVDSRVRIVMLIEPDPVR
ncbi:MAG: hypothetical protein M3O62_04885 [Pseudomonadota bacterium]|nr:hypothetical protein [Pseudomonadota bacterium]